MVFAAPLDDQLARVPHWVNPFDRWANPFDDFTTATNISWFDWEGYTSSPTGSSSGDFTESQLFSASVQVALRHCSQDQREQICQLPAHLAQWRSTSRVSSVGGADAAENGKESEQHSR